MKFSIKDFLSKCDQIRRPVDLVIFTEEILNGKFHFLCSVDNASDVTGITNNTDFTHISDVTYGVRTIVSEEICSPDNCLPDSCPPHYCPPDNCPPRIIAIEKNCPPDNCPG